MRGVCEAQTHVNVGVCDRHKGASARGHPGPRNSGHVTYSDSDNVSNSGSKS